MKVFVAGHDGDGVAFVSNPVELPLNMYFEPKEDITAYELALLLPFMHGPLYRSTFDALPPGVKRHLVEVT